MTMRKTMISAALAVSLAAGSVTAQGREAQMSEGDVANAMVSTQGSLPLGGPESSAPASFNAVVIVLVLAAVVLSVVSSRSHSYSLMSGG